MLNERRLSDEVTIVHGQPDREHLAGAKERGFRTVIDLRTEGEQGQTLPPSAEAAAAEATGLAYTHVPVRTDQFDSAALDQFRRVLSEADAPVLVHCASGKRAGTFVLADQAIRTGRSGAEIVREARDQGLLYGSDAVHAALSDHLDQAARQPG